MEDSTMYNSLGLLLSYVILCFFWGRKGKHQLSINIFQNLTCHLVLHETLYQNNKGGRGDREKIGAELRFLFLFICVHIRIWLPGPLALKGDC